MAVSNVHAWCGRTLACTCRRQIDAMFDDADDDDGNDVPSAPADDCIAAHDDAGSVAGCVCRGVGTKR